MTTVMTSTAQTQTEPFGTASAAALIFAILVSALIRLASVASVVMKSCRRDEIFNMAFIIISILVSASIRSASAGPAVPKSCRRYETFNVAFINAVPDQNTRMPRVIATLNSSDSDVICLQEIWMEKDLNLVVKELGATFPHHFSAMSIDKDKLKGPSSKEHVGRRLFPKETACSVSDTLQLALGIGGCGLLNGCLSKSGFPLGVCVSQHCKKVLRKQTISPSCVSCMFLNAFHSLAQAVEQCSVPKSENNRFNDPGLLLLSKTKMTNASYINFFPDKRQTFQRGYLQEELDDGTKILCTHLSSNLEGYLEYDLDFDNYKSQQSAEIQIINSTFGIQELVLIGDLNTGPRVTGNAIGEKNLAGEFMENYDQLLSDGFRSPYMDVDGRCTYCSSNELTDDYPNQVLDHVMIKGQSFVSSNEKRLYDIESPLLSDHYGVGVKLCRT